MQLGGNAGVCLDLSSPSRALFFSSLIAPSLSSPSWSIMEPCKGEGVETGLDPILASVLSLGLGAQISREPQGCSPYCSFCLQHSSWPWASCWAGSSSAVRPLTQSASLTSPHSGYSLALVSSDCLVNAVDGGRTCSGLQTAARCQSFQLAHTENEDKAKSGYTLESGHIHQSCGLRLVLSPVGSGLERCL